MCVVCCNCFLYPFLFSTFCLLQNEKILYSSDLIWFNILKVHILRPVFCVSRAIDRIWPNLTWPLLFVLISLNNMNIFLFTELKSIKYIWQYSIVCTYWSNLGGNWESRWQWNSCVNLSYIYGSLILCSFRI